MFITIVFLLAGLMTLFCGVYYLIKESADTQQKRIYILASFAGLAVTAATLAKTVFTGL